MAPSSRSAVRPAPPRRLGRVAAARGAVRLAIEGVHGVTRIAEGLHGSIARLALPVGRVREAPAGGIAGFVYRTVRGSSSLVGQGLDALLAPFDQEAHGDDSPAGLAWRAALNGVVGDHLARTGNPLALPMELIVRGPATPRILLQVHGLCMSDAAWTRKGVDHGQALAQALDRTPVYVRYNSGLHVSTNGDELAARLEDLLAHWPVPVESLAIVGHSMGGLVARSAVHRAQAAGMAWPRRLRQMVFLGTPHHGAALERGGNWLHAVLGTSPYLAPFTRLGTLRSDGITDLRHGNLLAADWRNGRHLHHDTRTPVPLPAGVACYAVAGALGPAGKGKPWGDGLVSVDSALGRHPRRSHALRIPRERTWVARGVHHLDLLSDASVAARLAAWLA
ncbi:esterase/lipase family protein [Ramlibacter sp. AN1133]|uniref:esterase/lipase family protein n=1 Tax=Ramlibacter sp. AN1133 TaxID=3133429 RepID=UPI0030C11BA1